MGNQIIERSPSSVPRAINIVGSVLAGRPIEIRGHLLSDAQRDIVLPLIERWVWNDRAFNLVEDECIRALADADLPLPGLAGIVAAPRRMRMVYVAGPYRAPTREAIAANIQRAADVGLRVASMGYSPAIPHMNTAHMDEHLPELGDKFWLQATLEMMRRCDAVVLVQGHQHSIGTQGEIHEAHRIGIPVYASVSDLPAPADLPERLRHA